MTETQLRSANDVVWNADLSTKEKVLLLALVTLSEDSDQSPGIRDLSACTRLGRNSVFRTLDNLERKGALRRISVLGDRNRYDLSPVLEGRLPRRSAASV